MSTTISPAKREAMLTTQEQNRLNELEEVIERNLRTFYQVGNALLQIRDDRLYKATHKTFEHYCQEKWAMTANYARRLVASAAVVDNIKSVPNGTIPTTESQVRPLAQLEPEKQREVWRKAVETAPAGKVTAKHVKEAADKAKRPAGFPMCLTEEEPISPEFLAAYKQMFVAIQYAKNLEWKETSKRVALFYVRSLVDDIKH
jgi:hypothetical protein